MKKLFLFFIIPFITSVQGIAQGTLNDSVSEQTNYDQVNSDQTDFFNKSFGRYSGRDYDKWRFVVSIPAFVRFSSKLRYIPGGDAGTSEQLFTTLFNRLASLESKDIPAFGLRADVYRIFSNNLFLNLGAESFILKKAEVPMGQLISRALDHIQPYSLYLNLGHVFPQTATSGFNLYFGFGYNLLTYKRSSGPSIDVDKDFLYQIGISYMLKRFVLDLKYSLIQDDKHIYEEVRDVQRKLNLSLKLITVNVGFYF